MKVNVVEKIIKGGKPRCVLASENQWKNYVDTKKSIYKYIDQKNFTANMISEANWMLRKNKYTCEGFGTKATVGDVCFIDFGQAYINEVGYQHFGLIISINNNKALVVPMTSNQTQYNKAYDPIDNPRGKKNLFRIGKVAGLNKESVLFLNDAKYINMARIIDVKGSIDVKENLFKQVKIRLANIMFNDNFSLNDIK